jgi:hypothetical protein
VVVVVVVVPAIVVVVSVIVVVVVPVIVVVVVVPVIVVVVSVIVVVVVSVIVVVVDPVIVVKVSNPVGDPHVGARVKVSNKQHLTQLSKSGLVRPYLNPTWLRVWTTKAAALEKEKQVQPTDTALSNRRILL